MQQQRGNDIASNIPLTLISSSSDTSSKDAACFVISRKSPARTLSRRSNGATSSVAGVGAQSSTLSLLCENESDNTNTNATTSTMISSSLDKSNGSCSEIHPAEPRKATVPMTNTAASSNHHIHHRSVSMTSLGTTIMAPHRSEATILMEELWASTDLIFQNKLTWLLLVGPVAIAGDSLGLLGEATCFALSGIALIPCAER